jgi:hypothetical protein
MRTKRNTLLALLLLLLILIASRWEYNSNIEEQEAIEAQREYEKEYRFMEFHNID